MEDAKILATHSNILLSNIYGSMMKNTAYRDRIICVVDTIHRLFWE